MSIYRITIIVMVIYSLFVLLLAYFSGVYVSSSNFKGYAKSVNWSFFPAFWLLLIPFAKITWHEFVFSWESLLDNKLLRGTEVTDIPKAKDELENEFKLHRTRILLPISIALATIVMYVDTAKLRDVYSDNATITIYKVTDKTDDTTTYKIADKIGTRVSDESILCSVDKRNKDGEKFYLSTQKGKINTECKPTNASEIKSFNVQDIDWSVAWLREGMGSKDSNERFVQLAYIQQYVAIILGFVALLQIWYHVLLFHNPELLRSVRKHKLKLSLDPYSRLHEFGLERWNQAINSVYWWLAVVLLIPIASRASQNEEVMSVGQIMINWLVPLLFLSPMLFTIAARQKKMETVWDVIRNEGAPTNVDLFHKQLLWPLDKNWASKLGIILSFALLSYLIGDILNNLGKIL